MTLLFDPNYKSQPDELSSDESYDDLGNDLSLIEILGDKKTPLNRNNQTSSFDRSNQSDLNTSNQIGSSADLGIDNEARSSNDQNMNNQSKLINFLNMAYKTKSSEDIEIVEDTRLINQTKSSSAMVNQAKLPSASDMINESRPPMNMAIRIESSTTPSKRTKHQPSNNRNKNKIKKDLTNLNLNLSFDLWSKITYTINKYASLLNSKSIKQRDKIELIQMHEIIIRRLSILSCGDNENDVKDYLDLVRNIPGFFEMKSSAFYLKLNWILRNRIMKILMKDFESVVLFADLVSIESKMELIEENYQVIKELILMDRSTRLIIPLSISPTEDRELKDSDEVKNIDKPEDDKVVKLETRFKEINLNKDKAAFSFHLRGAKEFLSKRKLVCSPSFYCLQLPWCLQVRSNKLIDGNLYLEFYLYLNDVDLDDTAIKASYKLCILHPFDKSKDRSFLIKNQLFADEKSYGFQDFIAHSFLSEFIKDDCLRFGCRIEAEKVFK